MAIGRLHPEAHIPILVAGALLAAALFAGGCVSAPPEAASGPVSNGPQPSPPMLRPGDGVDTVPTEPPSRWFAEEPVLRKVMEACSVEGVEERWEDAGAAGAAGTAGATGITGNAGAAGTGCVHSYLVSCRSVGPGTLDAGMAARCSDLGFGEPKSRVFKIAYETSCHGQTGTLTVRHVAPFSIRLDRPGAQTCVAVEPAWVQADAALLRRVVGAKMPVAAAWRHDGSPGTEGWDLEYARTPDGIDQGDIEEHLSDLGYAVVSDGANGKHWTRKRPCDFSFYFAKGGYRDDRLITSRWSPAQAAPCAGWP